MFAKIEIKGLITLKSGMHIGASDAFAAIGSLDSPVTKDPLSSLPYIPGSSLKGKMRSLLAKAYSEKPKINSRDEDPERVKRLFGCSKDKDGYPCNSRLIFSDSILCNEGELRSKGLSMLTESKEENSINPLTAIANPRQIERVVKGAQFPLALIYNAADEDTLLEDFETIANGLKLLTYDYIGGHGSRGYGRVEFDNLEVNCVIGQIDDELLLKCKNIIGAI